MSVPISTGTFTRCSSNMKNRRQTHSCTPGLSLLQLRFEAQGTQASSTVLHSGGEHRSRVVQSEPPHPICEARPWSNVYLNLIVRLIHGRHRMGFVRPHPRSDPVFRPSSPSYSAQRTYSRWTELWWWRSGVLGTASRRCQKRGRPRT